MESVVEGRIQPAMARQIELWPVERLLIRAPGSYQMAEEWRDVVGFEADYEVSSRGRVRSKRTGSILRPWIAGHGYCYLRLGRKNRRTVHALVASAFCGPRPSPLHEVAHWDGVGTNNFAANLRWATHRENIEDQRRHGTLHMIHGLPWMRGDSHPRAKLTERDVLELRRIYNGSRGQLTELARSYGVDRTTVKRAAVGSIWCHV